MKTHKLAVFVSVALLMGAASAQTAQRSTTNLNTVLINTDPVPVQSGEDAQINFKIRNTGNTQADNVQVQIMDSYPFQLKPDRQRNYTLGQVIPGEEYQISTDVLVADDAPDGQNDLKVKISHGDYSVTEKIPVEVQSQQIDLNLANLQTTPSQLTADTQDAKLSVDVVNNGEKTAENTVLTIDLPESFEKTSSFSTRQALGNIDAGETKSAQFTFDVNKSAGKGQVHVPAELSYTTGDSNTDITDSSGFDLYLAGKPQYEVTNLESSLKTGTKGQIKVTVRNTGSEKSSSTRMRVLDSSDLPFSYDSSSLYIGTLEPGQTGTVVFDVDTEKDAAAKDYLIDFEIRGTKDTQVYVDDTTLKVGVEKGEQSSEMPVPLPVIAAVVVILAGIYYFRDRIFGGQEIAEKQKE